MEAMSCGSLNGASPGYRQSMDVPPEIAVRPPKTESVAADDAEPCLSLPESVRSELAGIGGLAFDTVTELEMIIALSQEVFLERLYARLAADELKLCEKVSFCLNADGKLVASNPDEKDNVIEKSLSNDGTLAVFFAEIAWRSELLRNLKKLCELVALGSACPSQRAQWVGSMADEKRSVYQLTIKGEMSHFYFR